MITTAMANVTPIMAGALTRIVRIQSHARLFVIPADAKEIWLMLLECF